MTTTVSTTITQIESRKITKIILSATSTTYIINPINTTIIQNQEMSITKTTEKIKFTLDSYKEKQINITRLLILNSKGNNQIYNQKSQMNSTTEIINEYITNTSISENNFTILLPSEVTIKISESKPVLYSTTTTTTKKSIIPTITTAPAVKFESKISTTTPSTTSKLTIPKTTTITITQSITQIMTITTQLTIPTTTTTTASESKKVTTTTIMTSHLTTSTTMTTNIQVSTVNTVKIAQFFSPTSEPKISYIQQKQQFILPETATKEVKVLTSTEENKQELQIVRNETEKIYATKDDRVIKTTYLNTKTTSTNITTETNRSMDSKIDFISSSTQAPTDLRERITISSIPTTTSSLAYNAKDISTLQQSFNSLKNNNDSLDEINNKKSTTIVSTETAFTRSTTQQTIHSENTIMQNLQISENTNSLTNVTSTINRFSSKDKNVEVTKTSNIVTTFFEEVNRKL